MQDNHSSSWLKQSNHYHPPGTAPGTLVQHHPDGAENVKISVIRYNENHFIEKTVASLQECWQEEVSDEINWINIEGNCSPAVLSQMGEHYGLHPLALEDVLNSGQPTKLERYDDYYFMVLHLLSADEALGTREVSIFWGKNYIISIEENEEEAFENVRNRLRHPQAKMRELGSDYLAYCLVDTMVDRLFPRMEALREELDQLEDSIFFRSDKDIITRIHNIKMRLLLLAKLVWGNQELIAAIQNEETEMSSPNMQFYLRDCYDHTVQLSHTIDNYREISNGMVDTYLSLVNSQQTEVMKVVTIIGTICSPLTFIVGIYGMNFNPQAGPLSMPELNWRYGYVATWGVMVLLSLAMIAYFRRRKWF